MPVRYQYCSAGICEVWYGQIIEVESVVLSFQYLHSYMAVHITLPSQGRICGNNRITCIEYACWDRLEIHIPAWIFRTSAQGGYDCSNVLLSVGREGRSVEVKSMGINYARPTQLAVAAGDCFVGVYDRRMMSLCSPETSAAQPPQPTLLLAPPHLISSKCLSQLCWVLNFNHSNLSTICCDDIHSVTSWSTRWNALCP